MSGSSLRIFLATLCASALLSSCALSFDDAPDPECQGSATSICS